MYGSGPTRPASMNALFHSLISRFLLTGKDIGACKLTSFSSSLLMQIEKFTEITLDATCVSLLMDLHMILITKLTLLFSEVTMLIRICQFFPQTYYFFIFFKESFAKSIRLNFHFKVWLESVKQLGSTFRFFVSFRGQVGVFCAKSSQNCSLMEFAQNH